MSDWETAWSTLTDAIGAENGYSTGSITEVDHLNFDQRVKVAEVAALLSISQELNAIRKHGINTEGTTAAE
ncbi:hypothetical protein [Pseudoclavibacter helvolus]|uniref:hypothetical protein n=1 Tax=Pseudoclavibacter helvolus TaxID=255205 RepID=UPI000838C42A|nr:hypothetical protein [Pseudoclavibacter helvolus]